MTNKKPKKKIVWWPKNWHTYTFCQLPQIPELENGEEKALKFYGAKKGELVQVEIREVSDD